MNKKNLGAFYTPVHTVDFMLSLLKDLSPNSLFLEPSGGDGVFISRLLENKKIKSKQIEVWDINPEVKEKIESFGVKFTNKDTLLETPLKSNNLFGEVDVKYTHIVGNPPYLSKNSQYIKTNKKKLGEIYKDIGANDAYSMFLYLCCNLLEKNGQLVFIISDTFLTLGIHKKLRKFLLDNFTIKQIILCPSKLFSGVAVNTCIIYLVKNIANEEDKIIFNDCRKNEIGNYSGKIFEILQNKLLEYPDYIFTFNGSTEILDKIKKLPKLIDYLDGGLGMHTKNNAEFLGIVNYDGIKYASKNGITNEIDNNKIDGINWKFYHKKGGNKKYFLPAEYAIKWDNISKNKYKIPKNMKLDETKIGFVISGICSELSARMMTPEAVWESNKAMCFFSKDDVKYKSTFFIGILNSSLYIKIMKLFNHTNSIQIRDIRKLPMFDFSDQDIKKITEISEKIIETLKKNLQYDFTNDQNLINIIVEKYV